MGKIFHGHLILASTFVFNFVAIGAFNTAGLYIAPLSESFPDYSTGIFALYCTLQIVAGITSSLLGGICQDWLETKDVGVNWLFFSGGVFMGVGFFLSSICATMYGVLVGATFVGIGIGFGGFMSGGICVLWFEAARGMNLLFAMSGQGVGGVFFARATAGMLERYDGEDPWRPTMRWIGLVCLLLSSVASIPMRMPEPGEVEAHESGADAGEGSGVGQKNYGAVEAPAPAARTSRKTRGSVTALEHVREQTGHGRRQSSVMFQTGGVGGPTKPRASMMLGSLGRKQSSRMFQNGGLGRKQSSRMFQTGGVGGPTKPRASMMLGSFAAMSKAPLISLDDFVGDDEGKAALASLLDDDEDEGRYTLGDVAWTKTNIYLAIFSFVACFAVMNMLILLPPYVSSLGMPLSTGGLVIVAFNVGGFLSNITLGVVADQIGARRLLALAFFILSGLFFVWPHCETVVALEVIAFFNGYFTCTISSMPIIILADAFSESSSEHILALNGMINMVKFPGYLLGPPLAGVLVEVMSGNYTLCAAISGLLTMISAIFLLMIPSPEDQQKQLEEAKERQE